MKKYFFMIFILLIFSTQMLFSQSHNAPGEKFVCFNGICLAKSTLSDVQDKFGKAVIVETGDAGGYDASIYYYSKKENILIKFYSGELGGDKKELTGYAFEKMSGDKLPPNCVTLDKSIDLNVNGIYIGMTREKFSSLLGKSNKSGKYEFTHSENLNGTEYDVLITIEGKFKDNRLIKFEIDKAVTN